MAPNLVNIFEHAEAIAVTVMKKQAINNTGGNEYIALYELGNGGQEVLAVCNHKGISVTQQKPSTHVHGEQEYSA